MSIYLSTESNPRSRRVEVGLHCAQVDAHLPEDGIKITAMHSLTLMIIKGQRGLHASPTEHSTTPLCLHTRSACNGSTAGCKQLSTRVFLHLNECLYAVTTRRHSLQGTCKIRGNSAHLDSEPAEDQSLLHHDTFLRPFLSRKAVAG